MGIVRAETIARMRGALKKGLSASKFISNMRAAGISYRRSDMLADWRSVNQLAKKEGTLRFVRKGRYPTETVIAAVSWDLGTEYMYTVRVQSQTPEGVPEKPHFVNINTNVPMTPEMVEQRAIEERAKEEKYAGELLIAVTPWSAVRKVTE